MRYLPCCHHLPWCCCCFLDNWKKWWRTWKAKAPTFLLFFSILIFCTLSTTQSQFSYISGQNLPTHSGNWSCDEYNFKNECHHVENVQTLDILHIWRYTAYLYLLESFTQLWVPCLSQVDLRCSLLIRFVCCEKEISQGDINLVSFGFSSSIHLFKCGLNQCSNVYNKENI